MFLMLFIVRFFEQVVICLTMPKFTLHLFCYVTKKHYIKKDVLLKGFTSKGCFTEKLYIRSQR